MRVYVAIGLVIAIATSCFWAGYEVASGKAYKQQNRVITNEIKNRNADTKALQKHTIEVQTRKVKAQDANKRIERNTAPTDCPVDEFQRLWEQASFTARK